MSALRLFPVIPTGLVDHGGERRPEDSLNFKPIGPDNDWRIRNGMDHLDDYFAETVKPTVELFAKPRSFFDDLSDVRDIFIHRHDLADADEPYFSQIIDRVDLSTMSWIVSTNGDLADRQVRFGCYGIAPHLVRNLACPILIEALAGFSLTPDISRYRVRYG